MNFEDAFADLSVQAFDWVFVPFVEVLVDKRAPYNTVGSIIDWNIFIQILTGMSMFEDFFIVQKALLPFSLRSLMARLKFPVDVIFSPKHV